MFNNILTIDVLFLEELSNNNKFYFILNYI